jgi:hypothetical protein
LDKTFSYLLTAKITIRTAAAATKNQSIELSAEAATGGLGAVPVPTLIVPVPPVNPLRKLPPIPARVVQSPDVS